MSIKKLRDRKKWQLIKAGLILDRYWERCPVCLHKHEITKEEYEKRKK